MFYRGRDTGSGRGCKIIPTWLLPNNSASPTRTSLILLQYWQTVIENLEDTLIRTEVVYKPSPQILIKICTSTSKWWRLNGSCDWCGIYISENNFGWRRQALNCRHKSTFFVKATYFGKFQGLIMSLAWKTKKWP